MDDDRDVFSSCSRVGALALAALAFWSPARASEPVAVAEMVLPSSVPEGAWVEVTVPSEEGLPVPVLWRPAPRRETERLEAGERPLRRTVPSVPDSGTFWLCTGAEERAVACGVRIRDPEGPVLAVEFPRGRTVVGEIRRGPLPEEAARIAVRPLDVPEGTESPFLVPLGYRGTDRIEEVRTEDDGRFALPSLAPGRYGLEIWLRGGRIDRSFELVIEEASDEPLALDPLVVSTELASRVLVRTIDGDPLEGAEVRARAGGGPEELRTWRTFSGVDGIAELDGFGVGERLELHCEAEGHSPRTRVLEQAPPFVDCALEPLARVRATVVDPLGAGNLGIRARLVARSGEPGETGESLAQTETAAGRTLPAEDASGPSRSAPESVPELEDATGRRDDVPEPLEESVGPDGLLRFEDVAPGLWDLTIAARGREAISRRIEVAAGDDLDLGFLVLSLGIEREIRVVEAETLLPLEGVWLESRRPRGVVRGTTDEEGSLRFVAGGSADLLVEARAERHAADPLAVPAERLLDEEPVLFEMERAGWIAVTVWVDRPRGRPCAGCRLRLDPGRIELETDASGIALSPPLVPRFYRLRRSRLDHLGSVVLETSDAEERSVAVVADEVVRVELTAEEAQRIVRVVPEGSAPRRLEVRSPGRRQVLSPESDGSFVVRRRPEGELRLTLLRGRWDLGIEESVRLAEISPLDERDEVVLRLPSTRLTARVQREGRPWVGDVEVREIGAGPVPGQQQPSLGDPSARTRTDADGRLDLVSLPPGVYTVRMLGRDAQFVTIAEGQTVDLGAIELR